MMMKKLIGDNKPSTLCCEYPRKYLSFKSGINLQDAVAVPVVALRKVSDSLYGGTSSDAGGIYQEI